VARSASAVTETRLASSETRTRPAAAVTETQTVVPSQSVATVTETRPALTVSQSTTVGVTVAAGPVTQAAPSAATTESEGTPGWVWVLVAVGGGLLIALLVWVLRRRSRGRSAADRERLVAATVAGLASQGWAIESQTSNSAVLRQDGKLVVVTIDPDGRVTTRSLAE
jgi:hypothetical protein